MLCSVLIASRLRFGKLLKCIKSVYEHSSPDIPFEIIVRFHRSDNEAVQREIELSEFALVKVIWGQDLSGYESMGFFYHELIGEARGKWCWHLNDDMVVFSPGGAKWNERLNEVIGTNVLVQPEIHQLNDSVYVFDQAGPAPIHPREALGDLLIQPSCGAAVDAKIYEELVEKRHWPVRFLAGIGVHHQWGGVASHVA